MKLVFYLRYALRNLRRSGRWSIFAIFCIAAGVATVVALRSLGLSIADSLVDNVRISNHGDITITRGGGGGFFSNNFITPDDSSNVFRPAEVRHVRSWVREQGGRFTAYINYGNMQITAVDAVTVGRPQFVSAFLVEPRTFPPTGDILASDPAGVPVQELLGEGNNVLISENLAESQGLRVGDTVRVSGTEALFTVTGLVPTELEANLRNVFASFFGFAYLNIDKADLLQIPAEPNAMSIVLPEGTDLEAAEVQLRTMVRGARFTTLPELLETNSMIGDYIGRFIVIMGLGALLIGGVGIINTMLVMVGRRTSEIAALKTFGLKGGQVASIFLAEAFFLGLAGSVVGCIFGLLMTGAVNQYGEAFLQQQLTWRIHPEAIAYGLGLGMIVSMVFGIIPVLTAVRIRPAIILRPNEPQIGGVGCLQSLLGIALVVLVIGGVAGQIIGIIWVGWIGVAMTLLVMALLIGLLWLLVWIVGKLPTFGWVDMRLALRNLTARRIRTATTLLALSAGMFALSSITFVGAGTREILQIQLTQQLGGNVLIFSYASLLSPELAQNLLEGQLAGIDGIDRVVTNEFYELRLIAVNGEEPQIPLPPGIDEEDLPSGMRRELNDFSLTVTIPPEDDPDEIMMGRALTPEDRGQNVIILPPSYLKMGIQPGTIVTLRVGRQNQDFEVVGLSQSSMGFAGPSGTAHVPAETLDEMSPDFTLNMLQVSDEHLNQVLLDLSALVPPVLALDVTFLDGLLRRLIDQFSAIPTLVGLLSLLAAAVIMANTVALSTLERRRQIGILKTIGLKGRRVLLIMLLENTVVGLLGGLLGIGLSALGVAIMTGLGAGDVIPIPRDAGATAVVLVVASVVIAWVATLASAEVAIRERVANVLRYE